METTIGIVAGFVLAVPLTIAGSYYLFVLQRRRKEIGWEIVSSTPVITRPSARPDVRISVNAGLLAMGGDGWEDIEALRAFRIRIRNTGNEVVENLTVSFTLENGARAVSLEPEKAPSLGESVILTEVQQGDPRTARARIPFLNPKDEVLFSLQAINSQSSACETSAAAPGLSFYSLLHRRADRGFIHRFA